MGGSNLDRFKTAQARADSGFESALAEITSGRKRSHWIWYVFPQLSGLGSSHMSEMYALDGPGEGEEYLRDPLLAARLLAITTAAAGRVRHGVPLATLMGSQTDVQKLVSSLTLFEQIARHLNTVEPAETYRLLAEAAGTVLEKAESEGVPRCAYTLGHLRRWR